MLDRIREAIGAIWGRLSTLILAASTAVMAIGNAPEVAPLFNSIPNLRVYVAIAAAIVIFGRFWAPPPPAVTIKRDDAVSVDRESGTVTITKAAEIPAHITDKAPGEKL